MDSRIREKITKTHPENHRQGGLLEICLRLCDELERQEKIIKKLEKWAEKHSDHIS